MDKALKEHTRIPDKTFPINIFSGFSAISLHWHDHLEWIYVTKGQVLVQVDTFKGVAEAGDLVFVNSKQLHAVEPASADAQLLAVVFNEALLRSNGLDMTDSRYILPILDHQRTLPNMLKNDDPLSRDVQRSIDELVAEFRNRQPGHELIVKAGLYRILGLLSRCPQTLKQPEGAVGRRDRLFSELLYYLRDHFDAPITVLEAARMVKMSPNHFCNVFKKLTGKTLVDYVNTLRIHEAERLLRETGMSMTEISDRVGFGNITYFGRVFRKYKSVAPSDYRKRSGA